MLKESETAEPEQKQNGDSTIEPGEIQEVEVDMQAQAETIRTVFSDPKTFNVKVCSFLLFLFLYPSLCATIHCFCVCLRL